MSPTLELLRDQDERPCRREGKATDPAEAAPLPVTRIDSQAGWGLDEFRELWGHYDLLLILCWRDVKVRYKQTILGAVWAILQPLMMMVVFTIFFSRMAKVSSGSVPYPIFAYSGLLAWTFFASAILNGGNSVIGQRELITKVYFPRIAIPFAAVGAAGADFAVAFLLQIVLMLYYGIVPGVQFLLAPLVIVPLFLASLGVGTLLAAFNVSYRDFKYIIPFMTQVWMLMTPSIYMESKDIPLVMVLINPMTALIEAFRDVLLNQPLDWARFGLASACVVILFAASCAIFRRVSDNFADII